MSKIILYKGKRGSGKTLTMVKDGLKYFKNGWKVLRNFDLSFGDYISEENILTLDKNSNIKNCVIMMDEVQIFFDARRFMKKENVNFSNFIQQIRKRNITLLGTTQFSNTIDLRFRQHIDIVAYPNFISKGLSNPICEVIYVDVTSIEDNILGSVSEPLYCKIVYNPLEIFKLYKTEEMIK
jgi:hypothetical protein